MNTTEIYNAQLNVSNFFTVDEITYLIDKIKDTFNCDALYNIETKSIDIECNDDDIINDDITDIMIEWVESLPADIESKEIICDNINVIFNITKINNSIIKVYLY